MRVLTIVGKVDSRILAYTLSRALSFNGLTALISYDASYRRLYFGDKNNGSVSGVDIFIDGSLSESSIEMLKQTGLTYDNVVVVSDHDILNCTTGIIKCRGLDRSMASSEDIDPDNQDIFTGDTGSIPSESVYISYETPEDKHTKSISLKDDIARYVYSCEERKELVAFSNKAFNKTIAEIASVPLDIDSNTMYKLLTHDEYEDNKKVK